MYDSSDSSTGDDISIYDSSEVEEEEEEDSENSDEEEEDSENPDEEKIPTTDSHSSPKQVRNRLEMPPDDDSEIYDLSEEDSDEEKIPAPDSSLKQVRNRLEMSPAAAADDDDSEMYDLSEEEEEEEEHKTLIPSFWFSTEVRDWLELPPEIINMIFTKVGPIDILLGAQYVCTAWQNLSKQPHFYSSIDLRNRPDFYDEHNIRYDPVKLVIYAVNRSAGHLVEFSVEAIANDEMLKSITKIRSPLKCLRLVECDNIDEHDLMLMAKKLPLLEELEMLHCFCCKSMIRGFGRYCPQLKSFRLTCSPDRFCDKSNGQAFSIARNMPGLHHLDLFGNPLSDTGLIAILDQCLHLKSLDCRRCFRLTFGEVLFKRCTDRNIDVKLPDDCCVGCGFDTSVCDRKLTIYDFRDDDCD